MLNNFIVPIVDTDSITVCKADQSEFSKEELERLTDELNSQFDKLINWELEFYIPKIIAIKAKNYILQHSKDKVKIKGSALKASTKSPAMKEMLKRIIDSLLNDRTDFQDIYMEYIKEATAIKDITRWATRKTISATTLTSQRKNETIIKAAIEGTEIVEGDRIHTYYKNKDELGLVQNFDGTYALDNMLKSVYDTIWVFENVLDCTQFKNYTLKKMKKELAELMHETSDNSENGYSNVAGKTCSSSSTCSSIGST